MNTLREKYGRITRIICFLFAIHIFNLSIDPQDREPESTPEDLSFNEIESIAEFIAEVVFGIDDAFAEHDEPDETDAAHRLAKDFLACQVAVNFTLIDHTPFTSRKYFIANTRDHYTRAREIALPPPRA